MKNVFLLPDVENLFYILIHAFGKGVYPKIHKLPICFLGFRGQQALEFFTGRSFMDYVLCVLARTVV